MFKHLLLAATAAGLSVAATAQTVATFEDVNIPSGDTIYSKSFPNGTNYTIESGNARFDGEVASWGGWNLFNVSKEANVVNTFPGNMNSSIVGGGYNGSAQFATCYVTQNWAGNYENVPVGVKLINNAKKASGFYVTNSPYTYNYINTSSFYNTNAGYFHLIVKGYHNGVASADSVVVILADYSTFNPVLLNTWEWVDLMPLGNIDSLTFNLATNDNAGGFGSNTPNYFVMDNFTTLESESGCTDTIDLVVDNITHNAATLNWTLDTTFSNVDSVEIVINESATVAITDVPVVLSNLNTYNAQSLSPITHYYAHIRAFCTLGDVFTPWTSVPFTTLDGLGIKSANQLNVKLYPNPTNDIINIEANEALEIQVVDMMGKVIINQKSSKQIDLSQYAAGQYIIKLWSKNTNKTSTHIVTKK